MSPILSHLLTLFSTSRGVLPLASYMWVYLGERELPETYFLRLGGVGYNAAMSGIY